MTIEGNRYCFVVTYRFFDLDRAVPVTERTAPHVARIFLQ